MTIREQSTSAQGWQREWEERTDHIDTLIMRYTRRCGELTSDRVQRLTDELRLWFDQEVPHINYDPDWQRTKCDPHCLQQLLAGRLSHLLADNRLYISVVEAPVVEE
ncbi:MAG: hypothetical protein H7A35_06995 [Planctomycetales bacterium]|nr:hypothetical protein [bacterium]UNM09799.1 MAG: hypothetical protein H7A35_06995 [Planctomycetales bacterium]